MKREVRERTVSSQMESYGTTDVKRGIVTVQRESGEYVKLAVDSSFADFATLHEGADVSVEYEQLSGYGNLAATKIRLLKEED
ncbi:hypothetical protein EU546_00095 [Candidatus Thorarchaeota archaeon]|jgi:hypothetical protein|nr:MAG: hypothetical protein EU546_00095 [Candidatus Thorarchaeota archaeon]